MPTPSRGAGTLAADLFPDEPRHRAPRLGLEEGLGVDTRRDGSKEECRWVEDTRQPQCTRITPDGKRIEYRSNGRN